MASGVTLPALGSVKETAILIMRERLNRIDYYKTLLIAKAAILASHANNQDAYNAAIEDYNKILGLYQDAVQPHRISEREKHFKQHTERLKKFTKVKTLKGLLGDKTLKPQNKIENDFTMSVSEKNWGRVNA